MSDRFAGKIGIITGAGSGIGKATIERFVNEGGSAIAVDISAPRLQQLQQSKKFSK
ncbi:MAG: short chain dehydrogenase [Actinomycetota bacterium]